MTVRTDRRDFILGAVAAGLSGGCLTGDAVSSRRSYSVPVLGDTHFDAEPASVYHSKFIADYAKAGLHPGKFREHRRNGLMWKGPCREIVRASAETVRDDAAFVLHLGDLVQGDCRDAATHSRMLGDAFAYFRGSYPRHLPFVTVCGNHDVRDPETDAAEKAYASYMPARMRDELGCRAVEAVEGTDFVFRQGPDLYFVFDFNDTKEAKVRESEVSRLRFLRQKRLLETHRAERYTFVIVHGGVFPLDKSGDFRWFYLGDPRLTAERREMTRLLAARDAIVLCGHQHVLSLKDAAFPEGRLTELTMNTVFYDRDMRENPAVPEVVYDDPAAFGSLSGENQWWKGADARLHVEYRPYLSRCYHANAVGHGVLQVSDAGVVFAYYGRAARTPTETFVLR